MRRRKLQLAVIESCWWKDRNVSVKSLFDALAELHTGNPGAYHYEMFNTDDSLRDVLGRVGRDRGVRNVYFAAHGDEKSLYGAGDNRVSRTVIANTLDSLASDSGSELDGLYFGCCHIGNEETVGFLLRPLRSKRIRVKWVAGYERSVHWISAAAVDLWFWNEYYRFQSSTPVHKRIHHLARRIAKFMPGAHSKLGLEIFVRQQGRGGGVKGLIAESMA